MEAKIRIQVWIPFAFCSFVILLDLLVDLLGLAWGLGQPSSFPVLASLPICFFFTAVPMIRMHKQIERLKSELQSKGDGTDA